MKNLIAKLTTALLASEDFHTAIEMQIEEKVNEKLNKACEKIKKNTKNLEELSQHSRRNCLVIHGIKKERNENTNEVVKEFFGKYLKKISMTMMWTEHIDWFPNLPVILYQRRKKELHL